MSRVAGGITSIFTAGTGGFLMTAEPAKAGIIPATEITQILNNIQLMFTLNPFPKNDLK